MLIRAETFSLMSQGLSLSRNNIKVLDTHEDMSIACLKPILLTLLALLG